MAKFGPRGKNISERREKVLRDVEAFNIFGEHDLNHNLFDQGYVYYRNLQEYNNNLYKNVVQDLNSAQRALQDKKPSAQVLRNMAMNEARTEVRAINMHIGKWFIDENTYISDLKSNPTEAFKNVIEAINEIIQSKPVFQRSVERILNPGKGDEGKARVDIGTVLFRYVEKAMKTPTSINGLANIFTNVYQASSGNMATVDKEVTKYLEQQMIPNAVRKGIDSLVRSKTWKDSDPSDQPFKGLIPYITKLKRKKGSNPYTKFIDELVARFSSDDMLKKIKTNLFNNGNLEVKKLVANISDAFKAYGNSSRVGFDTESMTTFILSSLADDVNSQTNSIKMTVEHSGGYSMRPDIIVGYGITVTNDLKTEINDWFYNNPTENQSKREPLQEFILDYYDKIKNANDSFITYINQKSWNLTSKKFHERGGFSGGESVSAYEFERTIANNYSHTRQLIGMLMQIGSGAIGSSEQNKELLRQKIATMVAHFLFDDYVMIGRSQSSTTQAVHVFNLDGIVVPLSLLLWSLAEAFDLQDDDTYKELVRVHLKAEKILYEDGYKGELRWPIEAWETQRDRALQNTKISINFFHNFEEIVRKYMSHLR